MLCAAQVSGMPPLVLVMASEEEALRICLAPTEAKVIAIHSPSHSPGSPLCKLPAARVVDVPCRRDRQDRLTLGTLIASEQG